MQKTPHASATKRTRKTQLAGADDALSPISRRSARSEQSAHLSEHDVQTPDHGADVDTTPRKADHVDSDARTRNLKRLRRIEGQVRGLQKMVEDDRYCADVLTQISSVHEALRSVGRELMRNHLKHCATNAIQAGEPTAGAMYDELVDMMYKHSR